MKQLAAKKGYELNVCLLEKGSEPGAHILSGAVMDPKSIADPHAVVRNQPSPAGQTNFHHLLQERNSRARSLAPATYGTQRFLCYTRQV